MDYHTYCFGKLRGARDGPGHWRLDNLMRLKLVTANRLDDGAVVYLDRSGAWSTDINDAATTDADAIDGPLAGEALRVLPHSSAFDWAWILHHPRTSMWPDADQVARR